MDPKMICVLVMSIILLALFNEFCAESNWAPQMVNRYILYNKSALAALRNSSKLFSNTTSALEERSALASNARTKKPCTTNIDFGKPIINVQMNALSWEELKSKFQYLLYGGHFVPRNCSSPNRVAVIIPYRDREEHLRILLNNIHPFLTKQELDYSIFVVEQSGSQTFNKGKLFNVGFIEATKLYDWQCILLHDVDIIPEDMRNLHVCPKRNPRHMIAALDRWNYTLRHEAMTGGSSMFTVEQYRSVNGMSNRYWGWGGEDDDLYLRTLLAGYDLERYNATVARYKNIKHKRDEKNPVNPCRYKLLYLTEVHWKTDGLSSLRYRMVDVMIKPLYTHILVDLLEEEERLKVNREHCEMGRINGKSAKLMILCITISIFLMMYVMQSLLVDWLCRISF